MNIFKHIILLPVYNDWQSLSKLLHQMNDVFKNYRETETEVLLINDCSIEKNIIKNEGLPSIKKISIINLNKNVGSQKAISIGLNYLKKIKQKSIITILDSDGEDDIKKIPIMFESAKNNEEKVIVSSRTKRQDNALFKLAYFIHKVFTLLFTFKWISYGNFSSFNSNQLEKILSNNSSWLAISSCIAKNCEIIKIKAERKKRLIGISKLSLISLVNHSLRVNAVFLSRVIFLSSIYILILFYLYLFGFKFLIVILSLIIIFNILLIYTFLTNNQREFYNFESLIGKITEV